MLELIKHLLNLLMANVDVHTMRCYTIQRCNMCNLRNSFNHLENLSDNNLKAKGPL